MSERAIFQATFCKMIQVQGRKVVQFVFEVPTEAADNALKALGGYQATINETWVAIARLDPKAVTRKPEKAAEAKKQLTLSQESALRCSEPVFRQFLTEQYPDGDHFANADEAAIAVRDICGVASRSQFDHDPEAAARWRALEGRYKAWCQQ